MLLLSLMLSLAVVEPAVADVAEGDNTVSLVREIDLDSGDSPLFVLEPAGRSSIAAGANLLIRSPERMFRTAPYLRVNEQNKVQLHLPRAAGPITVGHVADAGKGNVALCRGWLNEAWCEVTLRVDELHNTATLELVVPRRDGNVRVSFKQVN